MDECGDRDQRDGARRDGAAGARAGEGDTFAL